MIMNTKDKNEVIMQLIAALTAMLESDTKNDESDTPVNSFTGEKVEFVTIKQAVEVVNGISEHTIRQLVAQNKISFLRCGQGQRGKILINKASLLSYLNNSKHSVVPLLFLFAESSTGDFRIKHFYGHLICILLSLVYYKI